MNIGRLLLPRGLAKDQRSHIQSSGDLAGWMAVVLGDFHPQASPRLPSPMAAKVPTTPEICVRTNRRFLECATAHVGDHDDAGDDDERTRRKKRQISPFALLALQSTDAIANTI
uniref:Uncharacterized protein n=1 Tax=Plectus sambesii TaxID=2011161 RepID=A0A914UZS0_9BILA